MNVCNDRSYIRLMVCGVLLALGLGLVEIAQAEGPQLKDQELPLVYRTLVTSGGPLSEEMDLLLLAEDLQEITGLRQTVLPRGTLVSAKVNRFPAGGFMRPGRIEVVPQAVRVREHETNLRLPVKAEPETFIVEAPRSLVQMLLSVPSLRFLGKGNEAVLFPGEAAAGKVSLDLREPIYSSSLDQAFAVDVDWSSYHEPADWKWAFVPGMRQKRNHQSGWYFHTGAFLAGAALAYVHSRDADSKWDEYSAAHAAGRTDVTALYDDYESAANTRNVFFAYTCVVYVCQALDALLFPGHEASRRLMEESGERRRFLPEFQAARVYENGPIAMGLSFMW